MTLTTETAPAASPRSSIPRLWWQPGDGLRLLGLGGLSVGLAAVLTWLLPYTGPALYTGPLDRNGSQPVDAQHVDHAYGSVRQLHVGDRFTDGLSVLELPRGSTQRALIRTVQPVGLAPGLRYLGAMLGSPHRQETWQGLTQWPPPPGARHDPVPLSTPVTAAGRGWELYLGFEVARPGRYVTWGWRITYEVAGRTYQYTEPAQIVVCTPRFGASRGRCPDPDVRRLLG